MLKNESTSGRCWLLVGPFARLEAAGQLWRVRPLLADNDGILLKKLRYRYRLYPHLHQQAALAQAFGCARVVWNDALALCQDRYKRGEKYLGGTDLQQHCISHAQQTPERSWLCQVRSIPLQQSLRDLDKAFSAWWGCLKGRRKDKVRAPRCKKRSNSQSIRFTRGGFSVEGETLRLTKVGSIPITWSRALPVEASSVTLIKHGAGRYFTSFVVEVERPTPQPNSKAVGIDLGVASLAVTGDGEKIAPPKFLRSALKRIRRLQRSLSLSHKVKGSSNWQKARLQVARAHVQVADKRKALPVRAWRCSACGTEHHRDVNAARNILAAGLAARQNACGAESKSSLLVSGRREAGTHLNREVQSCAA